MIPMSCMLFLGYLSQFSQILLDELDKLPGDARTSIGFLCYDSALYYFNLAEGLSQPQMLCVPDLEGRSFRELNFPLFQFLYFYILLWML